MTGHPETENHASPLSQLVADIRAAVQTWVADDPMRSGLRVAQSVAPHLQCAGLLTFSQMQSDRGAYKQHVLHVEPDGSFSVVALVWLPGQRTTIHDHVAWCVTGVYLGAEQEVRYHLVEEADQPYLVPAGTTMSAAGTVDFLVPPGDIHEVRNVADRTSVSLHVYGADLSRRGSSIRRTYDLPVRSEEVVV
ncbi:cysteine dioxygenase family protein [Streptomyces sp. NBC_00988]|uniref:cysteine dioxygenase family protein n=1 Tax=Streptomyces sp. NBC_00988 TaxID=2903704 RepID=UPI0038644474|nr:cysteine dioxygenase family protein [Streptomyces sp. NBC_00988]